jgi:hypothetical protein
MLYKKGSQEPGASSNLALWPATDFDPLGIGKNYSIKTLCKYEIIDKLFYQKNDFICGFIAISNHFVTL